MHVQADFEGLYLQSSFIKILIYFMASIYY